MLYSLLGNIKNRAHVDVSVDFPFVLLILETKQESKCYCWIKYQ